MGAKKNMKLKILLIPFSVVISLVLIIGYIYPSWFGEDVDSIKSIKKELDKENNELLTVRTKKSNIEKLSQSLIDNADLQSLINRYYPTYRNDEDVVSNINSIAFSEGVFLMDMGIEYKKIETADDPVRLMAIPLQVDVASNPAPLADGSIVNPDLDENGNSLEDLAKARIKFIEASLEVSGNYEQIKRFTTSLNKVGLLNNIQSFKIYKKEEATSANNANEEKTSEDLLHADIVVGFGYLISSDKQISTLLNNNLFTKGEFDFYDIDNKISSLTGNYKQSEIGETGIANPFLKTEIGVE